MSDVKENQINEWINELDSLQTPLDALKKELQTQWHEEKALDELENEIKEPIKKILIKLLNKLSGFEMSKIKGKEVEKIANWLRNLRDIFGIDTISEVLLNKWNNVSYEAIRDLCDKTNLAELWKDVEVGKTIKITSTELNELLWMISKNEIDWAIDMLKYQITENISSTDLINKNSDLSQKIDEFIEKDESKIFKNSKDFLDKMDAAWSIYLKKYIPNWSEDTIFNMSTWMNLGFMEIYNHSKEKFEWGIITISLNFIKWDFSSLEKIAWKSLWFADKLNLIGKELNLDKDPDESEKYEVLNNPAKFKDLAKDYLLWDINDEQLKQKIIDSKKEDIKYPKINEDEKKKIDELSNTFWKNFDQKTYGAASIVSEVVQKNPDQASSQETSKKWNKPEIVQRVESFCDKMKIDWWIKDMILMIVWALFGINTKEYSDWSEKTFPQALKNFFENKDMLKDTIFDGFWDKDTEIEIAWKEISEETFNIFNKRKTWLNNIEWEKLFHKVFHKESNLIKKQKEIKDENWQEIEFIEVKEENGKKKKIITLEKLDLYIQYYDKKYNKID